jgi:hypothetical protein
VHQVAKLDFERAARKFARWRTARAVTIARHQRERSVAESEDCSFDMMHPLSGGEQHLRQE